MLTEIPAEQLVAVVEGVAREVLAEAGCERPPVDVLGVARALNLVIARDGAMDVRARFVRLHESNGRGRGTILLGDDPRPERRQWAVAHEVGECVAHRVFLQLGIELVDIPPGGREQVANYLASSLLLPKSWFEVDGELVGWDLLELKQIYRTASHELIARRMLEMGPRVIVTLFDQGALQWRSSNAMRRAAKLCDAELEVWRRVFELGEPSEAEPFSLPEGIREVRCWPVHEAGWRREILRAELEEWS